VRSLRSSDPGFRRALEALLHCDDSIDGGVLQTVEEILNAVAQRGDAALLEYTRRFDRLPLEQAAELEIAGERWQRALAEVEPRQREAGWSVPRQARVPVHPDAAPLEPGEDGRAEGLTGLRMGEAPASGTTAVTRSRRTGISRTSTATASDSG